MVDCGCPINLGFADTFSHIPFRIRNNTFFFDSHTFLIGFFIEPSFSELHQALVVCPLDLVQTHVALFAEPIERYFSSAANEAYHKKAELRPLIERLQYIGKRITFCLQEKQEVGKTNSSIFFFVFFSFFGLADIPGAGLWPRSALRERKSWE